MKEQGKAMFESSRKSESLLKRSGKIGALLALSSALHGGVLMQKEIGQMIENAPRQARSYLNSMEAGQEAEKMLVNFHEELESGEPIDIDLSDFYFNDELLRGGVSPEQVKQAKEYYDSVLNEAEKLLDSGATQEEVLGYILKMQGDYAREKTMLTDLLTKNAGNCEARAKYLSAAVQDLYPDLVKEGKVHYQLFGEFRDKNGNLQDGHIRVVIDEGGDTLKVLEGDAVFSEEKDAENPIPQFEATNLTVKSALVKSGTYSYTENGEVRDTGITKTTEEAAREWSSGRNSLMAFPRSEAKYGDHRGTANIAPSRVAGSWAKTNLAWEPDFSLEYLGTEEEKPEEEKREMTLTDIPKNTRSFDLTAFSSASNEVMKALEVQMLNYDSEYPPEIIFNAGFKADFSLLSPEILKKMHFKIQGIPEGNELSGIAIRDLWVEMGDVNEINANSFAGAQMSKESRVTFDLGRKQPEKKSVTNLDLHEYKGGKIGNLIFLGDSAKQVVILPKNTENHIESVGFADINFRIEGFIRVQEFYFEHTFDSGSISSYFLQESLERILADEYKFMFQETDKVDFKKMRLSVRSDVTLMGGYLEKEAFKGKNLGQLSISSIAGADKEALSGVRAHIFDFDERSQQFLEFSQ